MLEHYREAKERYDFQMGPVRGGLATALDMLTDALALVGQHGVYCRSQRQPQFPAMDIRLVMQQIEDSSHPSRVRLFLVSGNRGLRSLPLV